MNSVIYHAGHTWYCQSQITVLISNAKHPTLVFPGAWSDMPWSGMTNALWENMVFEIFQFQIVCCIFFSATIIRISLSYQLAHSQLNYLTSPQKSPRCYSSLVPFSHTTLGMKHSWRDAYSVTNELNPLFKYLYFNYIILYEH